MDTVNESIDESKIEAEIIAYLEALGFEQFVTSEGRTLEGVFHHDCDGLNYHVSIRHRTYEVRDRSTPGSTKWLYEFEGELYDEDDEYIGLASLTDLFTAIKETPDFNKYYVSPKSYICWTPEPPDDAYIYKKIRSGIAFPK